MVSEERKIRVIVVDDSAVMRKLIPGLLERDKGIEVVATAIDGDFALTKIEQLRPDVVTLDVDMPRMDGITTLGQIVSKYSIPVVMLSSLTSRGAELTMQALEMGAVDFICKPKAAAQIVNMAAELISKVRSAASAKVMTHKGVAAQKTARAAPDSAGAFPPPPGYRSDSEGLLVIGASSGGPHALRYLLPKIPLDFGAPILIVQHMPESFTSMLAKWLNEMCEIEVREAREGEMAVAGRALIAPGTAHLKVKRKSNGAGEIVLERGRPVNGHIPSVDVLFRSVAKEYGAGVMAVLLTGMGSDGAEGIGEIKKAGGHTLAQDRESSAIFGMPKVAIERGYIDKVLSLAEIPDYLVGVAGRTMGRPNLE
ncbi:MAG TPA: chemotaxis response regulator protein-glutamate methylesterase [Blastocatellia bacterium]|jgi:two-component system chemotaxis response regulator CheB|nr:chemotaxis response regulator protein-glutamate methylesterase [Blastocatellia bacterium]